MTIRPYWFPAAGRRSTSSGDRGSGMRHRGLRYMPALDGLRALAVVAVLLYHGNVSWAQGGYFGVDAFFSATVKFLLTFLG